MSGWLTRAVLLICFAILGAAAGGAVVGFTSTTVGVDQLGEFVIAGAIGTGLAILMGSVIIMRASPRGVATASGVALLLAGLLVGAVWLRMRADAPPQPVPLPSTPTTDPGIPDR